MAERCPCCGQEVREAYPPLRYRSAPPNRNAEVCWWRERDGIGTGCVVCGADVPTLVNDYGKVLVRSNRLYWSNACRQKAYRLRKKGENDA